MNYFEVRQRLAVLEKFLRLYGEYLTFTNRFNNPAAQILLQKMRPLVPMTIDSLRNAGVGTIVARDAPSRGQKKYKINIIKAIFRESLIQHFSLEEQAPLDAIEAAMVKYRMMRSRAFLQLFNPIFWLVIFIGYAAESPFILLRQCGFEEVKDFKKTAAGRFIKIIVMLLILIILIEAVGFRRWVWNLIGL